MNGAKHFELVGLYFLSKLVHLVCTKSVELYWDDGLAVIHQAIGPKMGRIRKKIIAMFKSEGISIAIDTNFIETDFLDVSFNLAIYKLDRNRIPRCLIRSKDK